MKLTDKLNNLLEETKVRRRTVSIVGNTVTVTWHPVDDMDKGSEKKFNISGSDGRSADLVDIYNSSDSTNKQKSNAKSELIKILLNESNASDLTSTPLSGPEGKKPHALGDNLTIKKAKDMAKEYRSKGEFATVWPSKKYPKKRVVIVWR